jgi:polar amino acid transport system ATP-binding protein
MKNDKRPLLYVENLHKHYKKVHALRGVNLRVKNGETVVIMGPSGCGKSTLIRCVNRLIEPDEGRVIFNDAELTGLNPEKLRGIRPSIGFVFQHFNLIHRLSALDNVSLGLRLSGIDREQAEDRAKAALERVGLKQKMRHLPQELSGGEQQRVGIARALAINPLLMLWDEPTASLDPILVGEVLEVMEDLVEKGQTTMVIVTHELNFARRAADRIVFMSQGEIVEEGEPEKVFERPESEVGMKYKKLIQHNGYQKIAG